MTADINQTLNIPVTPLPSTVTVAVAAEHDLVDVALVALLERLGYRSAVIDLDAARALHPGCLAVVVRTSVRVRQVSSNPLLRKAHVIGIGVDVDRAVGSSIADSPFAVGRLQQVLRTLGCTESSVPGRVHLSRREREVVVTYTLGATVRETAEQHYIAESTVRSHFRRVMRRYNDSGRPVANKSQLLLQLMRDGWVESSTVQ